MAGDFYVGPLGALVALPDVLGALDAPRARIGGAHVSLYGNRHHDTFGTSRSYSWARDTLTARQVAYVDALSLGLVPGPLRLVNTRERNRLPEQVASCGSLLSSEEGWDTTSGVLNYGALTDAPAPRASLPAAGIHRGALAWTLLSTGPAAAYPLSAPVPVLPGEQVVMSWWACGPSTITATLSWSELYADGTTRARIGTLPVALSPAAWTPLPIVTGPTPGLIGIDRLRVAVVGPSSATLYLAAGSAGPGGYDALPYSGWSADGADPLPYGGWTPGGGAPTVLVAPAGRSYTPYGTHAAALTLYDTSGGL